MTFSVTSEVVKLPTSPGGGGGGNLEVRRVRRGTEEEKIKESQIYPQVTNNFTSEDLTLVFMG